MDDLIRRSEIERALESSGVTKGFAIRRVISSIPAVDAVPVVHAYWTRVDYEPIGHDYICSECNDKNDRASLWCPDCGARMDGRREEEHDAAD